MINIEGVKRAIAEYMAMQFPNAIPRDIEIDTSINKVIIISGIRRSGKTFEIFNLIKEVQRKGVPRANILYVNFEDERFIGFEANDFDQLLDIYTSLSEPDKQYPIFLFMDEIQNVSGWDRLVRRLYDSYNFRIFLTGSSSKLLSYEISSALAGRNLTYIMYPLSFKEFLKARSVPLNTQFLYSNLGIIKKELIEYLEYGGFPEIAVLESKDMKRKILSTYYDAIVFHDIVERYRISNTNMLKMVLGYTLNSYSSNMSASRLYSYLKSLSLEVSKKTVNDYINYAESVFFISMNFKYSKSFKKTHQSRKKLYLMDTGFSKLYKTSDDFGKLLENAVYIELLRRKESESIQIFYYEDNIEIDFVLVRDLKISEIIQVCVDLNIQNLDREVKPLKYIMDRLNLNSSTIITLEEQKIQTGDDRIKIVPFYKWALGM